MPLVIGCDTPRAVELSSATPSLADLPEILAIARESLHTMILRIHHEHSPLLTCAVSLSAPSAQPVTVEWSTADGTAFGGRDYRTASGTVTFPPGSTSPRLDAEMFEDDLAEPAETVLVNLSRPVGATRQDDQGIGTILDSEPEKPGTRPR